MDIRNILAQLDSISEASMKSAEKKSTGPKFVGKWKGTDSAEDSKNKLVGGGCEESIIRDLERALVESNYRPGVKKEIAERYQQFLQEYGSTPAAGMQSQSPQGTSSQQSDPAVQQQKLDQQQIQKGTGQLAQTLSSQGTSQPLNKVKFQDVMNKLDVKPNTDLGASDTKQLTQIGAAASKALQNPQTTTQLKQVITKADQLDQQKQDKIGRAHV